METSDRNTTPAVAAQRSSCNLCDRLYGWSGENGTSTAICSPLWAATDLSRWDLLVDGGGIRFGDSDCRLCQSAFAVAPPEDLDLPSQGAFCWRHWLPGEVQLVLDDVTDYQEVKPYLPPVEPRFKVLMTTRV